MNDGFKEPRRISPYKAALISAAVVVLLAIVLFLVIFFLLLPSDKAAAEKPWHFGSFVATDFPWSDKYLRLSSKQFQDKKKEYEELLNKVISNNIQVSKFIVEGFRPVVAGACSKTVPVTAVNFVVYYNNIEFVSSKLLLDAFSELSDVHPWTKFQTGSSVCNTTFCLPGMCTAVYDLTGVSDACFCGGNCPLVRSERGQFCACPTDIGEVCMNGGVCETESSGYVCKCSEHFQGRLCGKDHCDNKCKHGDCKRVAGFYLCSCDVGFYGEFCDEVVDPCKSFPCAPGNCTTLGPNSYKCHCAENCTLVEEGYETCSC